MVYFLRPRIKISENIAYYIENKMYKIKVINNSYLFKLIDVKIELCKLSYDSTNGGNNVKLDHVPMVRDNIWYISAKDFKSKKDGHHAPYAVLFSTKEDLKEILKVNGDKLHFKVIARHGLTGLPKVKHVEYCHVSNIKHGTFKFGNNMEIEPMNN